MYVSNIDAVKGRVLSCSKELADYIIERNIPLLSRRGKRYYFSYTDLLEEVIEHRPDGLRKEGFSIE